MMVLSLMLGISFTEAKASKLTFKIANPDNGAKTVLSCYRKRNNRNQ